MINFKNFIYNNITQYYINSFIIFLSFIFNYFFIFEEKPIFLFLGVLIIIFLFYKKFSYLKSFSYGMLIGIICFQFKYNFFILLFYINFIFILLTPFYFIYKKFNKIFINIIYLSIVILFSDFYNNINNFEFNQYIYNYLFSIIIPFYIIFSFEKNKNKIADIKNFNFLFLKYF